MALSAPRLFHGIHGVCFWDIDTRVPHGKMLEVLGGASMTAAGESVELFGGSSKNPWGSEDGKTTYELSVKIKEFPSYLWDLFHGGTHTDTASSATGTVSSIANVYGTSCFDASTGIATATIKAGENAELKFSHYVVEVISSTTVNVYGLTNVDFDRGTDITYNADDMKLLAADLTISTGAAVEVTDTGVELTGGSGTIGMTIGDTACYKVVPANSSSARLTVGAKSDKLPYFGVTLAGQKRSDGDMAYLDFYRVKGVPGIPLPFEEAAWVETELKMKPVWDSTENAVYSLDWVNPTSVA